MIVELNKSTEKTYDYTIYLLDGTINLKLRTTNYFRIILWLKNNPDYSIMTIEELGQKFIELSHKTKGIYTGRDFINQMNLKWL